MTSPSSVMAALPAVLHGPDVAAIQANLSLWQQRITLKKIGRGHHYVIDGAKKGCASVTTVLNARVSPRLVDWSSRVEREACIETAWRMAQGGGAFGLEYAGGILPDSCKAAFIERFTTEAGAERENQKILREAGDLGTEVHALIEWHLYSKMGIVRPEPTVSDRAIAVFGDFEKWSALVDLQPVAMEFRLFSLKHNYGGTGDIAAYATLPGRPRQLYIVDGKTSKGIWWEMRVQLGAYRFAWEEMGLPEAGGLLLHLPKEGDGVGTVEAIPVDEPMDELMETFLAAQRIHRFAGKYR